MTAFEHLAVLISIVLGLGITQLLTSLHRVVQARQRVRFHPLPLLWAGLIFVTQIEWWWAIFAMRRETVWNFFYFLFVLLSPVTLYLASAFALPEIEPDDTRHYDLRAYYYENRGWFFGIVAAGPVLDAIRRAVQAGTWRDLGAMSNAIAAVLVVTLAVSRRPWYHTIVTLVITALFGYFIVSAALELR